MNIFFFEWFHSFSLTWDDVKGIFIEFEADVRFEYIWEKDSSRKLDIQLDNTNCSIRKSFNCFFGMDSSFFSKNCIFIKTPK